jgi:hypothetical protein
MPTGKNLSSYAKKLDKSKHSINEARPPDANGVMRWMAMRGLFLEIWKKRRHVSEISGKSLGGEPLTVFFHHILPKDKYPQAQYDEENIILLTLEEHDTVEANMYKYEKINYIRVKLLLKYDIA